jgi:hypothetical protein
MSVDLPAGWTGRIFSGLDPEEDDGRPTMHVGNWAMPDDDADFGSGIIASMSAADQLFMAIAEYTPDCLLPGDATVPNDPTDPDFDPTDLDINDVGGVAFGNPGVPLLTVADFDPDTVHGTITLANPTAVQVPFLVSGRPFVLYVVLGDAAGLSNAVELANTVLNTLIVSPVLFCNFELSLRTDFITFNSPLDTSHNPRTGSMPGSGTAKCVLYTGVDRPLKTRTEASLDFNGTYTADRLVDPVVIDGVMSVNLGDGAFNTNWKLTMESLVTPSIGEQEAENDPVPLPALITQDATVAPNAVRVQGCFVAPAAKLDTSIVVPVDTSDVTPSSTTTIPVSWRGDAPGTGSLSLVTFPSASQRAGAASAAGGNGAASAAAKGIRLGHARFKVRPHRRRRVRVKLNRHARRLLARGKQVRAALTVTVESEGRKQVHRQTLLLRRAPRRRWRPNRRH